MNGLRLFSAIINSNLQAYKRRAKSVSLVSLPLSMTGKVGNKERVDSPILNHKQLKGVVDSI